MKIPAEAYPLTWPPGRPRTPVAKRTRAKFHAQKKESGGSGFTHVRREGITLAAAAGMLQGELDRLGATSPVLSTNVKLRLDGLPYSGQRQPDDPGVAVYFYRRGQQLCFACDRWDRVEDNVVAVAKTIEALRGIDRWGTGDMVQAAFTGFQAIGNGPAQAAKRAWWVVLDVPAHTPTVEVEEKYRELARIHHPDRNPGDPTAEARMAEINGAYDDFKRERGLA